MKKSIVMSVAFFGLSLSLVQADSGDFLDRVQDQLFHGQTFSDTEEAELLELSSEAPRSTFEEVTTNIQEVDSTVVSSENPEVGTIKAPVQTRTRRNYSHFKTLQKPAPFYTQEGERIVDEPSIEIVRRKNRTAQQKLARYRAMFPAYSR